MIQSEISYIFNEEEKVILCEFSSRPTLFIEEILSNNTWIPGKSEWSESKITFNKYQDLKDFTIAASSGLEKIRLKLNEENWILEDVMLIEASVSNSKKHLNHMFVVIKYKDATNYLVK